MNDDRLKSVINCELCTKKPCSFGCPLNNDIQSLAKFIKEEKYKNAYDTFKETTALMSICGRICPHSKQCEGACIKRHSKKKVKIGKLETFIGDMALANNWVYKYPKETKFNVAIVGSGPAGLTCAYFLRKNGIGVTIYEKHDYLGGLLMHGIPEFRLSKDLATKVIDSIIQSDIKVELNKELGKNILIGDLLKKHDAIFLGIGANESNKLHVPGEKLVGVYGANEILEKNLDIDWNEKNVVVCGGGDVAMDISRYVKKKGANDVTIIYRGSEDKIPADRVQLKIAKREGINFIYNTNITAINGNKNVKSIQVINDNNKSVIKCDYVIRAIGSHPSRIVSKLDLKLNDKKKILIDSNGETNNKRIFAGGDVAGVKSTVAWASRSGRNAAYSIIKYLSNNSSNLNS